MPECACCATLTLRELYKNAQEHGTDGFFQYHNDYPSPYRFPHAAYFRHHQSWEALEESARDGCGLCSVIYDEFMNLANDNREIDREYNRELIEEKLADNLPTDIRISLDKDGSSSWLHAFIVQVGPNNYDHTSDDPVYDYPEPRIAFRLNRPKDASQNICELGIGRPELDADLGSEEMFNIARSWLHECVSEHVPSAPGCPRRRCETLDRTNLPTRVLDIGSDARAVVKLVITNNHFDYYATLSHCWGGGSSLMLTQENLDRFTQAIPMERAPRNFLDATSIARSLGFRYLWIDSLCIVQDSPSDWDIEAARMSDVYRNAVLTISASASENTTTGILNPYVPAFSTSLKHCVRLKFDHGDIGEIYLGRRLLNEEDFGACFVTLPLSQRGWALQEQILSRRNLYYGERTIYWTCRSSHRSADGASAGPFLESVLPDIIPALFTISNKHKIPDERTVYFYWLGVVETYSRRYLTHGSDKLAAISGLAREVHQLTSGRYVGGIWFADLFNGMLWYPTTPEFIPNTSYRGPSWSWVGLDVETNFATRQATRVPSSHDAEVVQVEVIAAGQNEFGAVRSGFAELKGLTLEIDKSKNQYYRPDWGGKLGTYLWRDKGQSPDFIFADEGTSYLHGRLPQDVQTLDVPDDDSTIEIQQCLALYLGIWADEEEGALTFISLDDIGSQELECQHRAYTLLLRPSTSTNEQTYERIGVLHFDVLESPFFNGNTWQTRVVTII